MGPYLTQYNVCLLQPLAMYCPGCNIFAETSTSGSQGNYDTSATGYRGYRLPEVLGIPEYHSYLGKPGFPEQPDTRYFRIPTVLTAEMLRIPRACRVRYTRHCGSYKSRASTSYSQSRDLNELDRGEQQHYRLAAAVGMGRISTFSNSQNNIGYNLFNLPLEYPRVLRVLTAESTRCSVVPGVGTTRSFRTRD